MKKATSSIIRYESRVTINRSIEEVFAPLAESSERPAHRDG